MFQNAVMVLVLVPVYFKNERNETIAWLLQKCIMKSGHPLQTKQRCKTRLGLCCAVVSAAWLHLDLAAPRNLHDRTYEKRPAAACTKSGHPLHV